MRSRRRGILLIASLTLAALGDHLPGQAQPVRRTPRVGIIWIATSPTVAQFQGTFVEALRQLGHVDGQNIRVEARYADGNVDRVPDLARELEIGRASCREEGELTRGASG